MYRTTCLSVITACLMGIAGSAAAYCPDNASCGPDQFCAKPAGHCDALGECHDRPEVCTSDWNPVCGCDGNTYGNACNAAAAGVSVAYQGECRAVCGGFGGIPCEGDRVFCKYPIGTCEINDNLGVCTPIPEACLEIYDPVCGCDGRTYSSECHADMAQMSIAYRGECLPAGCRENSQCGDDSFCAKPEGHCDAEGVCHERPRACSNISDPVCGCDGRTYSNACDAAAVGVNVAHRGECEQHGCHDNSQCGADAYCAKPDGHCDADGVCTPRPRACTEQYDPVCGCDGHTYANACFAAGAGVNVAHRGVCEQDGCTVNWQCGDDRYCAKPIGHCGAVGECRPRPDFCTDEWAPVCGCDGHTYSNACDAAAAGVSIAYEGECRPVCGGIVHRPCEDPHDFCKFPEGSCEWADQQGACTPIPEACPEIWSPVCGCDGQTYSNECEADRAGVTIDYRGECRTHGCRNNDSCGDDAYCAKHLGDCEGEGVCQQRPRACPAYWHPVCGCDGRTYGNECEAAAAGVNVAHLGVCEGQTCRGNDACGQERYCARAEGACAGPGICHDRPLGCPDHVDPVCGCDGRTYSNACDAAAGGVNVAHRGVCEQADCHSNSDCDDRHYCSKPAGHCDAAGACHERPQACIEIWQPVCGCDGNTYPNACYAASAGVNVLHEGNCARGRAGDLNGDQSVTQTDVRAFILAAINPAAYHAAYPNGDISLLDMNGDGVFDGRDIGWFIQALSGG